MNTRFLFFFLAAVTLVSVGVRLFPHAPNFTPIGALALFVGAYAVSKHWWLSLLPLAAMFVSDLLIGFYDAGVMATVYGSFLVYVFIGRVTGSHIRPANVLFAGMGGAVLFYLATNFAVWAFSSLYPHTLQGLLLSYTLALPFFRYTLLGDIFFSGVFFGAYAFAIHYLFRGVKERAGV